MSIMLQLIPLTSIKYNYTLIYVPTSLSSHLQFIVTFQRRHFVIRERKSRHEGHCWIKSLKESQKYGDFRHAKRHAHIKTKEVTHSQTQEGLWQKLVTPPFSLLIYCHRIEHSIHEIIFLFFFNNYPMIQKIFTSTLKFPMEFLQSFLVDISGIHVKK